MRIANLKIVNIGIDIRLLARGVHTGIEEYTTNLVLHIADYSPETSFRLFYNAFRKERGHMRWGGRTNINIREFSFPNRLLDVGLKFAALPKLDRLLGGCDVFLSPHFFMAPVSGSCKKVVVFHDLSFEYYPEYFSFSKRQWHSMMNPKKTAHDADKIIAVSESTKEDLVSLYKIPSSKIEVVYPGISSEILKRVSKESLVSVKNKYNLPESFLLYFGTIEPRKNIEGLVKAFEILKRKKKYNDLSLVIAGAAGWLYKDVLKTINTSSHKKSIILTGFVEEEDKSALYAASRVFVYPSFFEGFGFPPLEAMACGTPVVVSHVTSLPEIVADSGIMINPHIYGEIADAVELLLDDESLYDIYRKRGLKNITRFSWPESAKRVFDILTT